MRIVINKDILKRLRNANPYPDDVFIEPTKEQKKKVIKLFKDNNLSLDGYNGSWGRYVWNLCCDKLEEIFNERRRKG